MLSIARPIVINTSTHMVDERLFTPRILMIILSSYTSLSYIGIDDNFDKVNISLWECYPLSPSVFDQWME